MVPWTQFEMEAPELAGHGRRLLYQYGVGLGYLGTVRRDGGPRMHPVCPILAGDGLYVFIVNMSYKYRDLLRDPRYALHSFASEPPPPGVTDGDEEFYITGEAVYRNDDADLRARVVEATGGQLGTHAFEELFELRLGNALYSIWHNFAQPDTWPEYTKWRAG